MDPGKIPHRTDIKDSHPDQQGSYTKYTQHGFFLLSRVLQPGDKMEKPNMDTLWAI